MINGAHQSPQLRECPHTPLAQFARRAEISAHCTDCPPRPALTASDIAPSWTKKDPESHRRRGPTIRPRERTRAQRERSFASIARGPRAALILNNLHVSGSQSHNIPWRDRVILSAFLCPDCEQRASKRRSIERLKKQREDDVPLQQPPRRRVLPVRGRRGAVPRRPARSVGERLRPPRPPAARDGGGRRARHGAISRSQSRGRSPPRLRRRASGTRRTTSWRCSRGRPATASIPSPPSTPPSSPLRRGWGGWGEGTEGDRRRGQLLLPL